VRPERVLKPESFTSPLHDRAKLAPSVLKKIEALPYLCWMIKIILRFRGWGVKIEGRFGATEMQSNAKWLAI
jgi:hypothetical protein